jgi:hypothetical protein
MRFLISDSVRISLREIASSSDSRGRISSVNALKEGRFLLSSIVIPGSPDIR